MRAPRIPISYNTIKGPAIKSMVKRVASGVTMADRINAAMIACFRYFANADAVTTPTLARMVSTSGNSNAQPNISRNLTLKSM